MSSIPKDPILIYSYVNTKLRDFYDSLDAFCSEEGASREEIENTLAAAGFTYEETINQFR